MVKRKKSVKMNDVKQKGGSSFKSLIRRKSVLIPFYILSLASAGLTGYEYANNANPNPPIYAIGENKVFSNSIVNNMMNYKSGQDIFNKDVQLNVMREQLKKDNHEITDSMKKDFLKVYSNELIKSETSIKSVFGSDANFQTFMTNELTKKLYIESYVDKNTILDRLWSDLKGMSNVTLKAKDGRERELSPYAIYRIVGVESLHNIMSSDVDQQVNVDGETLRVQSFNDQYTKDDLKTDLKNDKSALMSDNVLELAKPELKKFLKANPKLVVFSSEREYNAFLNSLN